MSSVLSRLKHGKLGYVGETYVMYKLATMGIKSMRLDPAYDFDLLADNNARIEVKTAKLATVKKRVNRKRLGVVRTYMWNVWQFANHATEYQGTVDIGDIRRLRKYRLKTRDRGCDFFVCICLNHHGSVVREYIIPKEAIGRRRLFAIGEQEKGVGKQDGIFNKYKDRWDLIQHFHRD